MAPETAARAKWTPLELVNGLCLAAVLTLSVLVDGNGDIAGLGPRASLILTVVTFVVAIGAGIFLVVRGRGLSRLFGVVCLAVYVVMLLPLAL